MDCMFSRKVTIVFLILTNSKACHGLCERRSQVSSHNGTIQSTGDGRKENCIWKVAKAPNTVAVFRLTTLHIINRGRAKKPKACGKSNRLEIDGDRINCDYNVTQNISNREFCYAFAYKCFKQPMLDDCKIKNVSDQVKIKYVSDGKMPVGERPAPHYGFKMEYQIIPCLADVPPTFVTSVPPTTFVTSVSPNATLPHNDTATVSGVVGRGFVIGMASGGAVVTLACLVFTAWSCRRRRETTNVIAIGAKRHKVPKVTYSAVTMRDNPNDYEPVDGGIIASSSVYEITTPDSRNEFLSTSENHGYLCPTPVHASSPSNEYDTVPAGHFIELQYEAIDGYCNTQSPYEITEALD